MRAETKRGKKKKECSTVASLLWKIAICNFVEGAVVFKVCLFSLFPSHRDIHVHRERGGHHISAFFFFREIGSMTDAIAAPVSYFRRRLSRHAANRRVKLILVILFASLYRSSGSHR